MRTYLTCNLDIYVDAATGSDSTGDGTVTCPFQTLQAARAFVQEGFDLARKWVVRFHCAGNFTAGLNAFGPLVGQTNPHNEIWEFGYGSGVTATNSNAFMAIYGAQYVIEQPGNAMGISAPGGAGVGLNASCGGFIYAANCLSFQDCGNSFVQTSWGGQITVNSMYLTGNAYAPLFASGGVIQVNPNAVVWTMGNPTFTRGFAWSYAGGVIGTAGAVFEVAGTVNAKKYVAELNGVIAVGYGSSLPGNQAGVEISGGRYETY
jgi:hypothetical protein